MLYQRQHQPKICVMTLSRSSRNIHGCSNNVIKHNAGQLKGNRHHPRSMNTNYYRITPGATRYGSYVQIFVIIPLYLLLSMDRISTKGDLLSPPSPSPSISNNNNDSTDDCESCKLLVESFEEGMTKTMRGKHDGGDTSWEEKNLKSYADSEIRLVEIQENLCDGLSKGKVQCFSLAEEAENHIEDWWFNHKKNNVRLHDYLCINKLKKCCGVNAFGPTCNPCPSQCNDHGVCDGSGTRGGTGECICKMGYSGEHCERCQEDFYIVQTLNAKSDNDGHFSCLPCPSSCLKGCSGPNSANCTECKPGYRRDPDTNQCNDINECELNSYGLSIEANKLCPDGTYCLNTEGHYRCADCHRACATCLGFGRDKCISCASDHFMDDNRNCIYTRDYQRYDPTARSDENFLAYIWRRLQTDIVLKIMLNIVLYPIVRWAVERVNYGSALTRKVIIFLATINLQMEIYPFVQRMIVSNFGKNVGESSPLNREDTATEFFGSPSPNDEL